MSINTEMIFEISGLWLVNLYLGLLRDNHLHLMRNADLIIQNDGVFMSAKPQ